MLSTWGRGSHRSDTSKLAAYHVADSRNDATYGSPDYVTVR
jgi:hypothetical protein